jgi:hypothetical protein
MGKILIIAGIVLVIVGILIQLSPKVPFPGRLPGDIIIGRGNFKMFIPITTSILLSIILSVILYLINKAK